MTQTVLHILSQRPGRTGSGVTLESIVRCAESAGWNQHAIVGTSADDPVPQIGTLLPQNIHPLVFCSASLDFPVPGMSDVMPYTSTVFSRMSADQLDTYLNAWKKHLQAVIAVVKPDVIHSHHIWLMSALLKDVTPDIPVVTHCHATGLRQMVLCPHLADEVRQGCQQNEHFFTLHQDHANELQSSLDVSADRITVIGGGFNEEYFHSQQRNPQPGSTLVFAGKFSHSKGLPSLLDAFEILRQRIPEITLHIAGSGSGPEADQLRKRMQQLAPAVTLHGQLSQQELGELLRNSSLFVLPSFFEGFGLVVVEAIACGCRVVSNELPGIVNEIIPHVGNSIDLVPLPKMKGIDTPVESELPAYVDQLANALEQALNKPPLDNTNQLVSRFRWEDIFSRVEKVWHNIAD